MRLNVCFAHGKESGPWGKKISFLADVSKKNNCNVKSIDYTSSKDPNERVLEFFKEYNFPKENTILVGSSMGGYVSTVVSKKVKPLGLFLLAPAFYLDHYPCKEPEPCTKYNTIIHGWRDDVVPVENSIRFAKKYKCDLHVLDSNHRLVDSLDIIAVMYENFLRKIRESLLLRQ